MIDLHTHCLFSDGALVPAEHLRRVAALGYTAVAITDHADGSNLDFIIPRIVRVAAQLNPHSPTRLLAGIELTHVPVALFAELTAQARELGAQIVVGHGETVVEPVEPGTNRAAIAAGVDILAHPGLLSREDAELAAASGVFLELSGRKGHSLTNGHVASLARQTGARLVINADAHGPGDFLTSSMAKIVGLGAGLSAEEYAEVRRNMAELVQQRG
ncbi:MAG: histidinol phosphate phosphatase domain-containing protein [Desulfobulbaceae bacterium]|nr:MAG: histidinol phosphate phosphatase domain-containing protein [Desulfobulbaceae bacterium]